jgi:cytochrome c oxidase subunit 3
VAANTAVAAAPGMSGPVAHHFNNMPQQQASVRFGMWLFLVTEVLFFGGAFCAYTVYRLWFPKDFEAGSAALNVGIASVNTFLLLTSSLTITLAIRACYDNSRKKLIRYLVLTTVLGTLFLGLKAREYQLDYVEGLVPGHFGRLTEEAGKEYAEAREADATLPATPVSPFNENLKVALHHAKYQVKDADGKMRDAVAGEDYDPNRVQLFFMFYYSMTGLHVLHMVVGLGLLVWQIILAAMGFFDHSARYVYIETMSLYWHYVDMVWMFILPLLYLCGPHSASQAMSQFAMAIGMGGGH